MEGSDVEMYSKKGDLREEDRPGQREEPISLRDRTKLRRPPRYLHGQYVSTMTTFRKLESYSEALKSDQKESWKKAMDLRRPLDHGKSTTWKKNHILQMSLSIIARNCTICILLSVTAR